MTKKQYSAYLQSAHWQDLRKEMLAGQSYCARCEVPRWLAELLYDQDLHLHHLNYEHLGKEQWEDLEVLCRRCHEIETFGRSELKAPKKSRCELCSKFHFDYRSPYCPACESVLCGGYLHSISLKPLPSGKGTLRAWIHAMIQEPWGRNDG
jgi:hypothetical protein